MFNLWLFVKFFPVFLNSNCYLSFSYWKRNCNTLFIHLQPERHSFLSHEYHVPWARCSWAPARHEFLAHFCILALILARHWSCLQCLLYSISSIVLIFFLLWRHQYLHKKFLVFIGLFLLVFSFWKNLSNGYAHFNSSTLIVHPCELTFQLLS